MKTDQICEVVSPDTCWKITSSSALVIIDLCSHVRFSGGSANPKLSALSEKNTESHQEVRAECEQREKINTRGAIRMAYACNTEMKLTRHLGVHMADRRENHPVTLHSRAKCLKKRSSPFEALHRHPSGSLARCVELVERICHFHTL